MINKKDVITLKLEKLYRLMLLDVKCKSFYTKEVCKIIKELRGNS